MNKFSAFAPTALLPLLLASACSHQTAEEKAAADARAVAEVEAAQRIEPPVQPLELGSVNPTVRRIFNLSESGCGFRTDPNPGAFPLLVAGRAKAVLLINGQPAIFAADSGSPELAAGLHTKYVGRSYTAQIARNPDRVIIRDRFDRIVYEGAGTLACRG